MIYTNTDTHTRVWPAITAGGRTLELAPGERVDLGRRTIVDPYLKPTPSRRKATSTEESK